MTSLVIASEAPDREAGDAPYYAPVRREVDIFEAAANEGLAIMLKGPTGCGKTRPRAWPTCATTSSGDQAGSWESPACLTVAAQVQSWCNQM